MRTIVQRYLPEPIHRIADRLRGIRRVHFLHIGKTGGTAVREALRGVDLPRTRLSLHSHGVSLSDIPRGESVFFFVRDPLARFVSGFYSRKRRGRPRYDYPWRPPEAAAFSVFGTPDALGTALSSDDDGERAAAVQAMRGIQHVKDLHKNWFVSIETIDRRRRDVLYVGAQEHLARDFAGLCAALGVAEDIELPSGPRAHRAREGEDRSLSNQATRNLVRWYREDYDFLDQLADRFERVPRYAQSVGLYL